MNIRITLLALAAVAVAGPWSFVGAQDIPDRPEKLRFPPLTYEPPRPSEFRVQLKAGPVAYVVPDRTLPLVNITVLVRCGTYLDPVGKEGVAETTGQLLVRGGAGEKSAEELEERLAFLAASLGSGVGGDSGSVNLNLLSKDLAEGLSLLRDVLTAPRFQADRLDLHRDQMMQAMRQRNDDSGTIHGMETVRLAYGTHFWTARVTTESSVTSITADDLRAYHRKWFHPGNFVVAASGDFDRADLVGRLESLFATWPFTGELASPVPTNTVMAPGGVYVVDKDVNQGRVTVLLPGVKRDHPDYPAITVMNDILGGGGFTSRLMNRVRSDEGLAYGAGSSFPGGVHYARAFQAGLSTKSRTVAYATRIVLDEINRISSAPVSDEELNTAKRSFVDSFPGTFDTRIKVASQFASDEFTGRYATDPDYWKNWRARIESVSREDVQRVAREHLRADQAVILVTGQKEEILKGHPDHPVKLEQLASGKVVELPLRDPLTQEPLKPVRE
jgi:zinc protease